MYTFSMTRTPTYTLSVSDATKRGIAGLARDAETGSSITVERNHRPVAAIIGVSELRRYQEAERDLRDLAVVLIRTATDNGERTSLDSDSTEPLSNAKLMRTWPLVESDPVQGCSNRRTAISENWSAPPRASYGAPLHRRRD
jgi:PHD/YefM family antitoxin component YafN of YafNO toxin-antitoxin module